MSGTNSLDDPGDFGMSGGSLPANRKDEVPGKAENVAAGKSNKGDIGSNGGGLMDKFQTVQEAGAPTGAGRATIASSAGALAATVAGTAALGGMV